MAVTSSVKNNAANKTPLLKGSSGLSGFELVVQDSFTLVMAAREGILARIAFEVADLLQLHVNQMADILHTTAKTLQNYRQSKKKLSPAHSEQTLKLLALQ